MADDEIFEMDDEKTPAEAAPSSVEEDDDDEGGADNHERTVVDPGLLAEFMAAHPEDRQAAAAASAPAAPVEKPAPVKAKKSSIIIGGKNGGSSPFEEDEEPVEGKTSIASLAEIEAMAAAMSAEHAGQNKKTALEKPSSPAADAVEFEEEDTPASPAPQMPEAAAAVEFEEEDTPAEAAPAAEDVDVEGEFSFPEEGNTLNAPVEAAIKPVLDDLPRAKPASAAHHDAQKNGSAPVPVASAPVEEMEDMWNSFDEQDMGEWSARSSENKAGAQAQSAQQQDIPRQNTRKIGPGDSAAEKEEGRLICLSGELHGQEFPVTAHDISVGRQDDNTITIRDPSLSRHHASIVKNEDVYVVVDNNSSNGTFVNGQRIDRARLHSGDEIVFGNVAFRFVELGDAFKPAAVSQQPSPLAQAGQKMGQQQNGGAVGNKPPKRLIIGAMGVVMVMGILCGLVINKIRGPKTEQIDANQIRTLYNDGVASFKSRKWVDGLRQFTSLSQLEPESKLAKRYIKRIKREAEIEQRLSGIQNSITQGLLQEAADLLSKIPAETVYVAEVAGIKGQIDGESQKQLAKVKAVVDGDAVAEAIPLIENLRRQLPTSYSEQLDDLLENAQRKIAQAQEQREAAAAAASRNSNRGTVRRAADNTAAKATDLFQERKITAALNMLAEKGAPNQSAPADLVSLYNKISKFDESYQSARQEWQAKSVDDAIPALRKALNLENKITGGKSPYAQELRQWLADMLYIKGMRAFSAKQYPEAYKNFQEAVNNYPNHNQSRNKLNEISTMAQDLYRKAYIVKGTDTTQCKALLNQVIRMVGPTDPLHAKAKEMLSTLQ